ncbi:MAG: flagellar filament capping protein FliD [Sulfuricurvum sp.]
MAGTINSVGLGSSVLTSDIIDKLKANDVANMITPIDRKITLQKQKDSALSLLNSLFTTFQTSANTLNDDALYQKRNTLGNTSSVSVTADTGVAVQSFSISDTQLALKNVKESGSFISTSATIASGSGTAKISIGTASYDISYSATTTLDELKDSINTIAGADVKASTLQVGTDDYRLILTSTKTGAAQTINISDSTGGTLNTKLLAYNATTNPTGMQEIQAARDASFKYDGITLSRSTNEIKDLIVGVNISLLQDSGSANISINQDTQAISDELNTFVQSYNSLTTQLTSMTTSDATAGTVGIFNGDNSINAIAREINRVITSSINGLSLPDFGIDLTQTGSMTFNSSTFLAKFNADPSASETFLSGSTTVDSNGNIQTTDGVFTSMNNLLDRYTKSNGIFANLTTGSATELKALTDSKTRSQALLDARYTTMMARFSQYDSIMTKLANQFSSLQTQITAYSNGN